MNSLAVKIFNHNKWNYIKLITFILTCLSVYLTDRIYFDFQQQKVNSILNNDNEAAPSKIKKT